MKKRLYFGRLRALDTSTRARESDRYVDEQFVRVQFCVSLKTQMYDCRRRCIRDAPEMRRRRTQARDRHLRGADKQRECSSSNNNNKLTTCGRCSFASHKSSRCVASRCVALWRRLQSICVCAVWRAQCRSNRMNEANESASDLLTRRCCTQSSGARARQQTMLGELDDG